MDKQSVSSSNLSTNDPLRASQTRENDALYQRGMLVARVRDVEVDLASKEIRYGEIYRSDCLLLPDEVEYQQYRLVIQKVGYAANASREDPARGRVLRACVADIVGYREK